MSTLAPACYGDEYRPGYEVVDYFTRAFGLFSALDTYEALERAGIRPVAASDPDADGTTATYALDRVRDVLEDLSGGAVVLRCQGPAQDIFHEVWYVYFMMGSLQSGQFVPARDSFFRGAGGSWAERVRYLPKKPRGGEVAMGGGRDLEVEL